MKTPTSVPTSTVSWVLSLSLASAFIQKKSDFKIIRQKKYTYIHTQIQIEIHSLKIDSISRWGVAIWWPDLFWPQVLHTVIIHRSFFFYPFQTVGLHRSIKQTHFTVNIPPRSVKEQTTLGLASYSRNDKGLWPVIISPDQFMGKPLTLRYAALCLHLTGMWPILNAAVNCSSEGYSCTRQSNQLTSRRVYHIVTDHTFWVESIVTYHRIYREKCIT